MSRALSEKNKLSSLSVGYEDDTSTQPSVLESSRSNPPLKRMPTGCNDKMVQNMMEMTETDILVTRKHINAKIAEIKQEISFSMSASSAKSGEEWTDKKLALLYVDLSCLDEKKKELEKKFTKMESMTGQELEAFLSKH